MSDIFVGQSGLRIQLNTGVDITDSISLLIKYRKPGGSTGEWAANSAGDTGGVIYYDPTGTSEIDTPGVWTVWAYVTFADGRIGIGNPAQIRVKMEGE